MSTLSQMTSNVRTDLVIDPSGDVWSDATIQRFLNQYVQKKSRMMGLDFDETTGTFTLVAAQATYDLDSLLTNYDKLQSLRLQGKTNLLAEVDLDYFESGRDLTEQGEPRYYYFYGDKTIGLWPVPDGAITTMNVRFERAQPSLASGESPPWASRWHHVTELYALWKCFELVPGHEEKAERARQIFVTEEKEMNDDIWRRDNHSLSFRRPEPLTTLPLRERAS